jgi:hypothetical protein
VITFETKSRNIVQAVLVFAFVDYERTEQDGYIFPVYVDVVGWLILCSCIVWMPLMGVVQIFKHVVLSKNPVFFSNQSAQI